MTNKKWFYPVVLILLWIIIAFIVNPIGNFPLNDDWQYARPVWYLINNGYYFSPDGYSPIILSQVMWGTLFCLPAGFSFTTLRISVLALGITGVLVFYFLIRRITKNNALAFLGGLILLINPMYFSLSYSFMTDVPFLTFAIISVYFFYCSFESDKPVFIIMATIFSVVATLTRQFGVIIPIAYGITCLIKSKWNLFRRMKYFLPAFITIISLQFGLFWLEHIGSPLRPFYGKTIAEMLSDAGAIAFHIFDRSGFLLFYAGFFLLPVTLYNGISMLKKLSGKMKVGVFVFTGIFFPVLIRTWSRVPMGNIFNAGSIGPSTFRDSTFQYTAGIENIHNFSGVFSLFCFLGSVLLLLNAGYFIIRLFEDYKFGSEGKNVKHQSFLILCILGYAMLLFIPDFFFDRYLLIFIPLFFLLICGETVAYSLVKIPALILSAVLILIICVFSALGTHDYIALNRSRWEAWNYATTELKVSPHHIDGGYECNGWAVGIRYDPVHNKPYDDNEYLLSIDEQKGYSLIKVFQYQNYFPYETRSICLVHRN